MPVSSPTFDNPQQLTTNYQDCGLVLRLDTAAGDSPVAAAANTSLGRTIRNTGWVRRALVHVVLGGRAQPVIYRQIADGTWDIGTLMTDISFAIATPYPIEMAIYGASAIRVELKNTGAGTLSAASVYLQLFS